MIAPQGWTARMPDLRGAPLFLPTLAWLTGLLLARTLPSGEDLFPRWTLFFLIWTLPVMAALGFGVPRTANRRLPLLGLIALLGAVRGTLQPTPALPPDLAAAMAEGAEVTVEGIVADDPAGRGAGSRFRLRPEGGTALLQVDLEEGRPRYGDRLRLTGRIRPPEVRPEVDMREVLARHGVLGQMRAREWTRVRAGEGNSLLRGLYAARGFLRDRLRELLPDPEAGLLIGILLGDESGIPWPVEQAFARSGLSHIVAISGYNITLLTALALALFTRLLGRRAALWATLFLIPLYTLFVGAAASVVRAALMGALTLIALMLGRSHDALNALSLSAFAMTLWDPLALDDVGFQLSFAATLGLLFLAPPLEGWAREGTARLLRDPEAGALVEAVREALLVSLAAQIATAPLMLYHFRELSLIAPLANLLVLPVQPLLMALGIAAALGAAALGPLAAPLGWAAWWPLAWTIRVADLTARWPLATLRVAPGYLEGMLLFYGGALSALLLRAYGLSFQEAILRLRPHQPALRALGWIGALGAIAFTYLPDHRAKLVLFEGGDLLLVESPEGHRALWLWGIREASLAGLGRWLGPFDPHLDLLILEDSAKPALPSALRQRYPVRQILGEGAPPPTGLRIEMGSLILENREDGWLLRMGSQRILIARRRPNGEVPRVDLVVYRGDERTGLAIAQGWQAWGLLVGGSPAGGAAGAVSGLRQLRHAGGREWVTAWTDGRVWWFGSGR